MTVHGRTRNRGATTHGRTRNRGATTNSLHETLFLIEKNYTRCLKLCNFICGKERSLLPLYEGADLLHDCIIKITKSTVPCPTKGFTSWFRRIAYNMYIDKLRHEKSIRFVPLDSGFPYMGKSDFASAIESIISVEKQVPIDVNDFISQYSNKELTEKYGVHRTSVKRYRKKVIDLIKSNMRS